MGTGADGWQVMAAPLTVVVRVGVIVVLVIGLSMLWQRLRSGPVPASVSPRPPRRPGVTDQAIVTAYNAALLDGWPPGELLTFIEAGRRAGTSGEHVRAVIARHWAV